MCGRCGGHGAYRCQGADGILSHPVPEACDFPGTHTVYASMGATTQGELVRMVAVPLLVFLPQWRRYTGGGHLVAEITSWHALV
jgi:hypothetical protein